MSLYSGHDVMVMMMMAMPIVTMMTMMMVMMVMMDNDNDNDNDDDNDDGDKKSPVWQVVPVYPGSQAHTSGRTQLAPFLKWNS